MAEGRNNKPSSLLIVLGALLIFVGVYNLLDRIIPYDIWYMVGSTIQFVWGFVWPIALVVAGAYLLWASKKGKLVGFRSPRLHGSLTRSRADRRLLGVCGGIAYYFGVDSSMIRIISLILLIALPVPVPLAYLVLAVVIPNA